MQPTDLKELETALGYNLTALQARAYKTAKAKGWHDRPGPDGKPVTVGDRIALMHSELSEALEAYRTKGDVHARWTNEKGGPEGVVFDLADTVIRILDFCGLHGLDLEAAVLEKMTYNEGRPERHGGKHL